MAAQTASQAFCHEKLKSRIGGGSPARRPSVITCPYGQLTPGLHVPYCETPPVYLNSLGPLPGNLLFSRRLQIGV
jgi:hypothetical protein